MRSSVHRDLGTAKYRQRVVKSKRYTPDIEDHPSLEESECPNAVEEDPSDDPDDKPDYGDDEDE